MQIIGYFFPFILKLQSVQIAKSKLTGGCSFRWSKPPARYYPIYEPLPNNSATVT